MIYGERIRQVRELCGLTQEEFAERLGVTEHGVTQIEANLAKPLPQIVERIVFVTGFPIGFFSRPPIEFPLGSLLLHR